MLILVVCNGVSNSIAEVSDREETVQERLMRLIEEQHGHVSQSERIIDCQVLERLIENISAQINQISRTSKSALIQTEVDTQLWSRKVDALVELLEL